MHTIIIQTEIHNDQRLRIEIPCDLPPGPAKVVLVVQPLAQREECAIRKRNWDELYGLGKEIWQGIDPKQYVNNIREDRDIPQ